MALTLILFVIGFVILIYGADILVLGSSSIARKFGISSFVIGLTIVAFGTSAPELIVSVMANLQGNVGVAMGNIIGSNISNILLILGVAAVIRPLLVKRSTVNKEIPLSLLAVLAVAILANDYIIDNVLPNSLTRIDGLILLLFFSIFIYYTFGIAREKETLIEEAVDKFDKEQVKEYRNSVAVAMIIMGLAGLYQGGVWIVDGATLVAQYFGISEAVIGLSIVALGTSLPELAASGMAAYRGKTDIAVGNVVGSNIFNLLWVLGLSSVINPIPFDLKSNIDIIILFAVNLVLIFLIFIGKKNILARKEGVALLIFYVFFIVYLFFRG